MIALLSPAYFEDETAGREWQVFEIRKSKATTIDRRTLTRSIIPITWLPYSGAMPVVISQAAIFGQNRNGYEYEPVGIMLRSRRKRKEYAEFVNSLARYIVDSTSSFQLPELESTPDEVSNAFEDREEPGTNSTTNNDSPNQKLNQNLNINQNFLIIDGAFVKRLTEQLEERADKSAPVSMVGSSSETTQSGKTNNGKLSVFVIDDEQESVEQIASTGGFSPEFDVTVYDNSTKLLSDVRRLLQDRQEPDLVVVNPELVLPGTPPRKLLAALLDEKLPSAILAISRDPDAERSLESLGINDLVAILQKPFIPVDLLQFMRHWATIGRDKRYRRGRSDERPAFLSYSSRDKTMASIMCKWLELREIGVWYTLESLAAGDPWREKVTQGLDRAEVFIALISDNYSRSVFCRAELGVILDRLQRGAKDLRVIPVLYNPSPATLNDPQIKKCLNQHAVTIFDRDWLPGFQEILLSVQDFLRRRQSQS